MKSLTEARRPTLTESGTCNTPRLGLAVFILVAIIASTAPVQAQTLNVLHNFTGGPDGANPYAGLTPDSQGNFYGTTAAGDNPGCSYRSLMGCGTVYKVSHEHGAYVFNPLYGFGGGSDGDYSVRAVTIGPNGSLYGATLGGGEGSCSFEGSTGCGTIFNVTPSPTFPRSVLQPWDESVLYRFTGQTDGGEADTSMIFDNAGNMYGVVLIGGSHGSGAVVEFSPSGGGNYTESVIYSFAAGSDGALPVGGVSMDGAGNIYGTTAEGGGSTACRGGCGTVYELSPSGSSWQETVLHRFESSDGANPNSPPIVDAEGNLYGNTVLGGANGGGIVYELTQSGGNWTLTTLYSVTATLGAMSPLFQDSSGSLYEAVQTGGASGNGFVFKLTPSGGGWTFTDLYDFTAGEDGGTPVGTPIVDSSGNIYGTALYGGANSNCGTSGTTGCGTVWEITPN